MDGGGYSTIRSSSLRDARRAGEKTTISKPNASARHAQKIAILPNGTEQVRMHPGVRFGPTPLTEFPKACVFQFVPVAGCGFVYKLYRTRPDGSEKGYVGLSENPFPKRLGKHLSNSSGCLAIKAAIRKYGRAAFMCTILEPDVPLADIKDREKTLIRAHGTYVDGYNLTEGGETNPMSDPAIRKKHKEIMSSREFVERSSVKRNKTFKTAEYIERTSKVHIESWATVVDREKHRQSLKAAWERNREAHTAAVVKGTWSEPSFRERRREGMRLHFEMKKAPSVTPEQLAEFKREKAREAGRRNREKKRRLRESAPESLPEAPRGAAHTNVELQWATSDEDV